ncbi:tetraacyldisaccharide 4'-kinase [Salinimicrobium soli]|uniref:tetraacyldisaccharide 4'-kinase n=1 Tax=Salinimicrobium soli TaxID=1254399 RepID=UPI003AABD17C
MLKARKLLYPFSLLYDGITTLRNKFYDNGIFESQSFDLPVIAVGNLSVGGTGKSPMVEYLMHLLEEQYRVASLSRGYKRSSKGFLLLNGKESAAEVGDEPLQFKLKFPQALVAVDEKRAHGIKELLKLKTPPEVIILDDAFQHRKVKAGFYILLTSYSDLYCDDLVLPAGNLRESSTGAKRADVIVVTKCPIGLSPKEQETLKNKLQIKRGQPVFFSSIAYSKEIFGEAEPLPLKELQKRHFSLVTGIANPKPLLDHLQKEGLKFEHIAYPDHHNFSTSEIEQLQQKELILTTEKDFVRLKEYIPADKLFYLPIATHFIGDREKFEEAILSFVAQQK